LNYDTVQALPDAVNFTPSGQATPTDQKRASRAICDPCAVAGPPPDRDPNSSEVYLDQQDNHFRYNDTAIPSPAAQSDFTTAIAIEIKIIHNNTGKLDRLQSIGPL
jgi:hypothetical protein